MQNLYNLIINFIFKGLKFQNLDFNKFIYTSQPTARDKIYNIFILINSITSLVKQ